MYRQKIINKECINFLATILLEINFDYLTLFKFLRIRVCGDMAKDAESKS